MAACAARSESGDSFQMHVALAVVAGVSIHAVARGATLANHVTKDAERFQSTCPHGARPLVPSAMLSGLAKFQSTRPHGARPDGHAADAALMRFQSTRPHGARLPVTLPTVARCEFQSTRLHGARRARGALPQDHMGFNPRARTGRDAFGASAPLYGDCFNPRARTGRDHTYAGSSPDHVVSIHAPARGATLQGCFGSRFLHCFNPRARTGRDWSCRAAVGACRVVSIHAPARGATLQHLSLLEGLVVSIHAPARGATAVAAEEAPVAALFQSTRPHGARRDGRVVRAQEVVSIHAPARGATWALRAPRCTTGVSIHAPARGATWPHPHRPRRCACFNPRARTGRDCSRWACRRSPKVFQSTRPHEARRDRLHSPRRRVAVSIHAPARGATQVRGSPLKFVMFQSTRPHGARLMMSGNSAIG